MPSSFLPTGIIQAAFVRQLIEGESGDGLLVLYAHVLNEEIRKTCARLAAGCGPPPRPGAAPRTIATLTRGNQTIALTDTHQLHLQWSIDGVT
jgi:hypothetical protein